MSAPNLPVNLSKRAQRDYANIQVYTVRTWDEQQWARYQSALHRAFQAISDNPAIGRARDELRPGYRSYSVEQHVILYRVTRDAVMVVQIIAGRRDIRERCGGE